MKDTFDVKFNDCKPRKKALTCASLPLTNAHRAALARGCAAVLAAAVPHEGYVKYQFLADLPGSVSGSYSRNLNYLWLLGAVVLRWHASFESAGDMQVKQWYYAALEHNTTHLDVDVSTVFTTVQALKADAVWAQALVHHARAVAHTFLRPAALAEYFGAVFDAVENRQRLDSLEAADLDAILAGGVHCADLTRLVRVEAFTAPKGPSRPDQMEPALHHQTPTKPLAGKNGCTAFRELFFPP